MFIMMNNQGRFNQNLVSKTGSQASEKMCAKEEMLNEESVNMKKKNFRESANSLATTGLLGSMASSGKLKFANFDDHNSSSTASLLNAEKKTLASSVGNQ